MKNFFLLIFFSCLFLSLIIVFGDKIDFLPQQLKKNFSLGMDIAGGTILTYQIDVSKIQNRDLKSVLEQTKDLIERRINFLGVSELSITYSQTGRIIVEIPNIKDPESAKKIIGETPFLEFRVPDEKNKEFLPTKLTGKYIQKAEIAIDPNRTEPIVLLTFNQEGAKIFKELTSQYLGKPIGIYLDGKLISAPVVQDVVETGQAQIVGKFTLEEAKLLANRLNQGALPAPLILISESSLNPIFSKKILDLALKGAILGIILVIIFMIIFYRFDGLLADIALLFFIIFNLALYKILGVTISLASLSGFVLSVGMAVDANILIFERMKEEARKGLKKIEIVNQGFKRAFPSIRDSNVNTLIASLLIYFLATSFVKGFALTLFLGVSISFLTAVFFTHNLLALFYKNQ